MTSQIKIQFFKHPYAEFVLGAFEGKLCLCDFRYRKMRSAVDARIQSGLKATFVEKNDPLLEITKDQLNEYFIGTRSTFDIPLLPVGTIFQKEVWHALLQIPYGQQISYLGLAATINNPGAVRAVGSANGANGLAIVIPCHRVINSNGSLGGFAGGIPLKQRLLRLEQNLSI
ncbi:MAG: methylated-DNA--[protein]-cysteine S-methyltransferase [Porticoccaceae bacterium]|jgi:methylated-DNA-[protein]-cysteine S-methyltransferase|nr:methylated-DNA--[protein]-cysteine S-methyltransferase [Porticoccaceae bacterium]|tara:strand:- start:6419 stop:6934 length:516 start_codon:yes stop_codon:yes gene_type:complete